MFSFYLNLNHLLTGLRQQCCLQGPAGRKSPPAASLSGQKLLFTVFGAQVLVLGVVGVLSEAVGGRPVALARGRFTLVVQGCESTGETVFVGMF